MPNGFSNDEHKQLEKVFKDVYFGNGKPGLTTRMETAENCLEAHGERMDASDKRQDAVDKKFWWIIVLLVTTIVGISVDIAKSRNDVSSGPAQYRTQHSFND